MTRIFDLNHVVGGTVLEGQKLSPLSLGGGARYLFMQLMSTQKEIAPARNRSLFTKELVPKSGADYHLRKYLC